MQTLIEVILPVFLVIGFGYTAAWRGLFTQDHVSGLMRFATNFAIPVLLFNAIAKLDLSTSFEWRILVSFYSGAVIGFLAGFFGARFFFGRPWEDAVAIGFVGLFSNSLMLGLPITEQAYGAGALQGNYAIVSIHAPFCYAIGITAMEVIRARGQSGVKLAGTVLTAMFRNALIVGIAIGFAVNLSGTTIPAPVQSAADLMTRAALPAALFGLGGVLYQYRPEGDLRTILFIVAISLILHPAITWTVGQWTNLSTDAFRSAVLTSAMAPGVNVYLFATLYGRGQRVAASSVLIGTALSIVTIWLWLHVLP